MVERKHSDKVATATIAILTYNGEEYFEEILSSIFKQCHGSFQVIVIDSGSSDGTLAIVSRHKKRFIQRGIDFRLIEISNKDFGHGKTRNLAVREARSEFVVFLTQDATPSSNDWLHELLLPYTDESIVATFGPHLAREGCNPVIKRDMEMHFSNFGSMTAHVVQGLVEKTDTIEGLTGFFSDVNSSLRRSYAIKHPYKEVSYAEDQVMGTDILRNGYKKAYCPKAPVYHSHTYPTLEYLGRYFDEYRGLKESIGYVDSSATLLRLLPNAAHNFIGDARYIKMQGYPFGKRIRYYLQAFMMSIFRQIAAYTGGRYEKLPKYLVNRLSLELSRKRRNNA